MKKIKILFILHLPPPVHGAAKVGEYINQSHFINESFDATYINLSTSSTISEVGKGGIRKIISLFRINWKVIKALAATKYDLCYVTLTAAGAGFYKDLLIVLTLKIFRTKIIYHFHNKGVAVASNSWINSALYRFVFRNTKCILLSQFLYPDIKMYVKEKDVFYCPNGVPPNSSNLNHIVKQASPANSSKCQLLYLSNMIAEKGVYILLDAAKELKNRGLNFECHYVGGWSDVTQEAFERNVSERELRNFVTAHGPKYGKEKEAFLENADVFVFPTFYHNETFGLVNLEAMQYYLPIVSTSEGGIPDVVIEGETGFLVPQRNSEMLADKLETLIRQPELRAKMGTAGRERYDRYFTLEKFEKRLTDIMKEAVN